MFDSELAHMLKESKCYCIEFGVQTFNEKLKHHILKRKERTNILMKAFSICEEYGLRYDVDHLFGIPNEKVEDYIEAAGIYTELKGINRIKCHNLVYYRESEIYEYAPQEVKDNKNYKADFFSSVSGDKDMLETNKIFQKYYKILPLLPRPLNLFILKANNWKIFKYVPYVFVMFLMILLAIKNGDRRFKVYFKHYPRKLKWAFLGI